jgi:hypothetical protein
MTIQTPDFMAEEDMHFLVSLAGALTERLGHFSINLPNGTIFSNISGNNIKMVGIDQIKSALAMLMQQASDANWCLVMPTNQRDITERTKIGELYAIPVYIDPAIPKDNFLIQEETKKSP